MQDIEGEPKDLELGQDDETEDDETADLQNYLQAASMIQGWQGRPGEEDIRIRASALTVLGSLIEHTLPAPTNSGILPSVLQPTLDLVQGVLNHEGGSEKAILRRAAVLVLLSILKVSTDTATGMAMFAFVSVTSTENGQPRGKLDKVMARLDDLRVVDQDEVVRGHAESVLESMEAWRERYLQRLNDAQNEQIRFGLEGRLRGLDVGFDADKGKPKIEEVE